MTSLQVTTPSGGLPNEHFLDSVAVDGLKWVGSIRMKDYYLILKIPRDSSAEDIRKAHRRQFLRYHPDRSTEPDPTRFREAQEACDMLRDQEKRKDYNDRLKDHEDRLHTHPEPVHRGPMSLWEEFGTVMPDIGEILDHIRRDFFGPIRKMEPLRELNVEFILNPDEASCGGSLPLDVPVCEDCPRCDGRGGAFPFPCLLCDGKGWSWGKRTISVRIPPGVQDRTVMQIPLQKLRIEHLYLNVYIRIQPH